MYKIDFNDKIHVHFIGIGGISMSGLAEILLGAGFTISGSDRAESDLTKHLQAQGATINYPQAAENITDNIDLIVYTAAIREDNPEFAAAKASGKPMLTRAELLGEIMENYARSITVSGTHGKTTTTSMISQILLETADDPTISVGGILDAIHSNVHVGDSDVFITEACEYTNSYHSFFPKYNIILNVEADHLDFFKNLENVRASFKKFAENTSDDGLLIINNEIDDVKYFTQDLKCKVITYSLKGDADMVPTDISYNEKGYASFTPVFEGKALETVTLNVPGDHNISNALAAIALCLEMGIDYSCIKAGLAKFGGAHRRFEYKGMFKGATVIDDYAHHPTEIKASLGAAANYPHNRVVVCFQSHTYTRTLAFLDEFAQALSAADVVVLADIYPAREPDIYGVSSKDIADRIEKLGTEVHNLGTFEACEKFLEKNLLNNDLLITMGAGDVYLVGENLLNK
ncbi:UDP-N-acetylmuramate--L-alanine ligase [Pseudobutyrivibrio sp. YE44]|uniref:UDP-N-acetylmuramate--L-alanine ligase n=1 Tax=Pseudobutyrivibrio sp. YE44 TaxID=1520802 RepID=UPI000886539E|nr:UDP-N-acetylmuramate--L-alanine ligase [Pseudobutyrivibrio sp. YE44]SDB28247.1 UDP-N-acetylmuramate--L-alanine ligase [Pseudobutyrivibrio sp. YE44]